MTRVVVASSTGTVFEFYDFFLYGSLVTFFGALFFPPGNETAALLASLAAFGAGFAIRPLGALLFGRLGDRVGRKQTFLITIVLMGLSTALVGLIPTFDVIGWWAPALLVALRLVQGLALGGEYGGAAIYVAEHSDPNRRGYFTSWIQTTATLGLVLSLLVILGCRYALGEEAFREWGWRIPFLVSVILLGLSVYIRLQISESPLFEKLKREGGLARAPIRETLLGAEHRKPMAAVYGAVLFFGGPADGTAHRQRHGLGTHRWSLADWHGDLRRRRQPRRSHRTAAGHTRGHVDFGALDHAGVLGATFGRQPDARDRTNHSTR
jgi:MFS family permease